MGVKLGLVSWSLNSADMQTWPPINSEYRNGDWRLFKTFLKSPPKRNSIYMTLFERKSRNSKQVYNFTKKNYEQYSCKHIVGLNKYIFFIKLYPKVIVTVQLNGCLKIGIKGLIIDATFWFVLPVIPILKKYTRSFREQFFSVRVLIKEQKKHP